MDKKINQLIEIAEFAMEANDYAHAEKKYINALYLMDNPKSVSYTHLTLPTTPYV